MMFRVLIVRGYLLELKGQDRAFGEGGVGWGFFDPGRLLKGAMLKLRAPG